MHVRRSVFLQFDTAIHRIQICKIAWRLVQVSCDWCKCIFHNDSQTGFNTYDSYLSVYNAARTSLTDT